MTMMTIASEAWAAATARLDAAQSLLLVTHVKPDGDAIGSMLGLGAAWGARRPDLRLVMAVDGGVPGYLAFLPGSGSVVRSIDAGDFDVMVSLDSSDEARTGASGAYGRAHSAFVINVDHHATNTGFGDLHLVDAGAVSTTEVVFRWLETLPDVPLTPAIAGPLLTGLVTDTLGFRTSSVNGTTLAIASTLVAAGVDLHKLIGRTLGSKPFREIQLWQRVLASAALDGEVVSAVVTQADIAAVGIEEITDAGLAEFLVNANEAVIAVIFKEVAPMQIECSFRAKLGYDVGAVALALGGGGHTQASGATLRETTLDAARALVLPRLQTAAQVGARR